MAVVTRERGSDSRYGMGRSWLPVARALERRGHVLVRIDGNSLDEAALGEARRMERWLTGLGPSMQGAVASVVARAWAVGTLAARQAMSDGFHAIDFHDFMCAEGALWQARQRGRALAPWGYHQHSFNASWRALDEFYGPLESRLRRALQRIELHAARTANWVIFPAFSGAVQCATDLRLPLQPNWIVLRHPVAPRRTTARAEVRALLGASAAETVIVGIGQLVALKRFDRLIRALAALPDSCRLCLLGEGDQSTLIALAEQCLVADRVHIQAADDVGPFLAAADIYVSTSATEAFGIANAEALLAGLPCLIAASGAAPELYARHAQLLAPDLSDLEGELRKVVLDPSVRSELASRTSGFANELPSSDDVASSIERLYAGS